MDVKSRLHDVPVLRVVDTQVPAIHFNRVRLALRRLHGPLELELPQLRGLGMILDDSAWICVDRTLNDLPVVAWTDFVVRGRALHVPVSCRLRFYHAHAGIVLQKILDNMDKVLVERLRRFPPSVPPRVVRLRR